MDPIIKINKYINTAQEEFTTCYINFNNEFLLFDCIFLFIVIGLLSDANILSSAKKIFLQLILILLFVFISKLEVLPTSDFIDKNFKNIRQLFVHCFLFNDFS